jgi:phage terminase Nu1 subunit (DNA packaging protein)
MKVILDISLWELNQLSSWLRVNEDDVAHERYGMDSLQPLFTQIMERDAVTDEQANGPTRAEIQDGYV